jgi:shikimate kinase
MGSGKSTIGSLVARRLGRPYVDNDTALANATDHTAREVTEEVGIDALHRLETDTLLRALARPEPSVISSAASTIADADVRAALRRHYVVWLDIDVDTIAARVDGKSHRPVFAGAPRDYLRRLREVRGPLYEEVACQTVRGDGTAPADRVAAEIVAAFARTEDGTDPPRR